MSAPKVSPTIGRIVPHVIHLSGHFTATVAAIAALRMPQAGMIVAVSAVAQAKGGTQGTSNVDVKKATTSILSVLPDIGTPAAGTRADGTLTGVSTGDLGVKFAKDDEIVIDLNITGGSSPTIDHVSVQLDILVA